MERALKSLTTAEGRYAELVLHGPDGWRLARLVLDPWSVALFSSRGPAFAAVETLKAQGLTTVEAIDRLADGARLAAAGADEKILNPIRNKQQTKGGADESNEA